MAYKIRLLGKSVTAWQHSTVKDKQTGNTSASRQELTQRTTQRKIPCYSAVAVPNNFTESNESIKHSQLSNTAKACHIIIL